MKAAKRMAVGESLRLAACAGWRGLGKEVQLRVTPMTSPQKVAEGAPVELRVRSSHRGSQGGEMRGSSCLERSRTHSEVLS